MSLRGVSPWLCNIRHYSGSLPCFTHSAPPRWTLLLHAAPADRAQLCGQGLDLTRILFLRWKKVSELKSLQTIKFKKECACWASEWLKASGGKILTWKDIKPFSCVSPVYSLHSKRPQTKVTYWAGLQLRSYTSHVGLQDLASIWVWCKLNVKFHILSYWGGKTTWFRHPFWA